MQRREFILVSVLATASSGLSLGGCQGGNPALEKILKQPATLARVCDEKTILAIGKAYLEKVPEEASREKLVNLLLSVKDSSGFSANLSEAAAHSLLEEKTRQDFRTGNTVILAGWFLSITESRQCALLFLQNKN